MNRIIRIFLILAVATGLSACGGSKFKRYNGPEVTRIEVHKADRKMYLLHGSEILKDYDIELGGAPDGPKHFEGDGKTPEGSYRISYKNPRSHYHLSLGISYPDENDVAYAKSQGKEPGGDIMIHGDPNSRGRYRGDWTAGCIAVNNRQIEEIYSMIQPGTPILITP